MSMGLPFTVEGLFAASDPFWCWLAYDVKSWNAESMPASWETIVVSATSSDNTVIPSCFWCSVHSQTIFPLARWHLPHINRFTKFYLTTNAMHHYSKFILLWSVWACWHTTTSDYVSPALGTQCPVSLISDAVTPVSKNRLIIDVTNYIVQHMSSKLPNRMFESLSLRSWDWLTVLCHTCGVCEL